MHKYWSGEMEKEKQGTRYSNLSDRNTESTDLDGLMFSSDIKTPPFLSNSCDRSLSCYLSTNLSWAPQEGGANLLEHPVNCAVPPGDTYASLPYSFHHRWWKEWDRTQTSLRQTYKLLRYFEWTEFSSALRFSMKSMGSQTATLQLSHQKAYACN